jgi:formylglycine-generating enzyme required for sulfatase activity
MGSLPTETDRDPDEGPRRHCTMSSFWLGSCPVTQGQYQQITGKNYSRYKDPELPASMLTRPEAIAFCERISEIEKARYVLPTEAQWEYACRAGSETAFCFGDDPASLREYGWFAFNSNARTQPVGRKRPNAWGLFDMHGNVWEWCSDLWSSLGYAPGDATDPIGVTGYTHVIRGGCFYSEPQAARCAKRFGYYEGNRFESVGFRVVRLLDPGKL